LVKVRLFGCLAVLLASIGPVLAWDDPSCAINRNAVPVCGLLNQPGERDSLPVMGFAVAPTGMFLVVVQTDWNLPEPENLSAAIRIDQSPTMTRPAWTRGTAVLVELTVNDLVLLVKGTWVSVRLPVGTSSHSLAGASPALAGLVQAYHAFTSRREPFAGRSNPGPSGPSPAHQGRAHGWR
jgi:hypothetical protein